MSKPHVSYGRLHQLLDYEPATGLFTWKVSRGAAKAGDVAGSDNGRGYMATRIDGRPYKLHRLAFLWMTGEWPKKEHVDHINRIKTDNRWCNLREATVADNFINRPIRKDNKTGVKGVSSVSGKWKVQITHNRQRFNLGFFTDLEEAAAMFQGVARLLRGESHLNGE